MLLPSCITLPPLVLFLAFATPGPAQTSLITSRKASSVSTLTADPNTPLWRQAEPVVASNDRYGKPVPSARTEIRSRWDSNVLSFLFVSKFESLKKKPNPSTTEETWGLWDYDVVEVFIGHDLNNMNVYKEFEVSPQSEWVDLDVDRDRKGKEVDWLWNSGLRFKTRVDDVNMIWYCEMAIPWKSISPRRPAPGQEFRINLYRIEGEEPGRKYIAWQPVHSPSYHTPKAFGRLRLTR